MRKFFKGLAFAFAFGVMTVAASVVAMADNATITLEDNGNDTNLMATEVQVNTNYAAVINSSSDEDWYKFSVTQNGYFNIEVSIDSSVANGNIWKGVDFTVYGVNDTKVITTYTEVSTYEGKKTNNKTITPGTYYIKISSHNYLGKNFDGLYDFRINVVEDACWENGTNNTSGNAQDIISGTTYHGAMTFKSDTDWYKITTSGDGYLTVKMNLNQELSGNASIEAGWNMEVRYASDPSVAVVSFKNIKTVAGVETYKIPLGQGTYLISISMYDSDYSGCWGVYDLEATVTKGAWENGNNDSTATANKLTVGSEKYGNCLSRSDVDWYTFTITKNGYFNVTLSNLESNDSSKIGIGWNFSVYSKNDLGKAIVTYEKRTALATTTINLPYDPGEYYIKVSVDSSAFDYNLPSPYCVYSLKVTETKAADWESESNNSAATADVYKLNSTVNGYLMNESDVDYYKMVVPADGKVDFSFMNTNEYDSGYGWAIQMFKSTDWDTDLLKQTTKQSFDASVDVKKGTYYVKVKSANSYYSTNRCQYTLTNKYTYSAVSGNKATNVTVTSIKLSWTKDANVTGYEIYRSTDNKTFTKIATISKNSTVTYTDSSVKADKTYYYKIRKYGKADGKNVYGAYCKTMKIKAVPKTLSISSVKAGSKCFTVNWAKDANVTGYEVQYATNSDFTKGKVTKNVAKNATVSLKVSSLTAGKKYYVRIRSYKTVDGKKVYSAWSTTKTATPTK